MSELPHYPMPETIFLTIAKAKPMSENMKKFIENTIIRTKGQLISEQIYGVLKFSKIATKYF